MASAVVEREEWEATAAEETTVRVEAEEEETGKADWVERTGPVERTEVTRPGVWWVEELS